MAKPEEVLITTDDEGNAVQVFVENTENNSLYELMKELLISLSKLNWPSMKIIMDV
jgi:exportin-1